MGIRLPTFARQSAWKKHVWGEEKIVTPTVGILKIYPRRTTAWGAESQDVLKLLSYPEPLRENAGILTEHVQHLGFADRVGNPEYSLMHVAVGRNPQVDTSPQIATYKAGNEFYSILDDANRTGYFGILKNVADRAILLKVLRNYE